jgi:hypothetical protein
MFWRLSFLFSWAALRPAASATSTPSPAESFRAFDALQTHRVETADRVRWSPDCPSAVRAGLLGGIGEAERIHNPEAVTLHLDTEEEDHLRNKDHQCHLLDHHLMVMVAAAAVAELASSRFRSGRELPG